MGWGQVLGGIGGFFLGGGPQGAAIGSSLGGAIDGATSSNGAKAQNDANSAEAARAREFNAQEAQKNRDFQERMRQTSYQTAITDMKAAGLNPMLAYTQGGSGTPSGATAAGAQLPQVVNEQQGRLVASATEAQIANTYAQTAKTLADKDVSLAMAEKVKEETALTTTSTGKVAQETVNLKEQVGEIQGRIRLMKEQSMSEVQRQGVLAAEAGLKAVQQQLSKQQISLTEAQTKITQINAKLATYDLAGARNKSNSDETFWGRNIRPYIQDAGRVTNSATSIYQLRR